MDMFNTIMLCIEASLAIISVLMCIIGGFLSPPSKVGHFFLLALTSFALALALAVATSLAR